MATPRKLTVTDAHLAEALAGRAYLLFDGGMGTLVQAAGLHTCLLYTSKSYVAARYPSELGEADVVVGYRADDSYFSFARAFLENRISLAQLERAMKLGGLGRQVVAVSEAAFGALRFVGAEPVSASLWHEKRMRRDEKARQDFDRILHKEPFDPNDVYMLDLMREG